MTNNNIAFPLSSVATNSSLEKISSTKDSGFSNSFHTVLNSYVTQPNTTDDKPVKNQTSNTQQKIADDSNEVNQNKLNDTSDEHEASQISNQDTESAQVDSKTLVTANKKELTTEKIELQKSDNENPSLQDQTNLAAPSLINIIAAQTFNNKLADQDKTVASGTEAIPAATSSENIIQTKVNTDTSKLINTDIETPIADQLKLASTPTPVETAASFVSQTQIPNQMIAGGNQSATSYAIPTNFYSDNWDSSLHQQVLLLRHNKIDNATLILNPEHLGPIHISIQIDAQSQTSIQFWSQNPDVRQALREGLPNLNSLFQESGLQLGSADVSSQQNSSSDNSNPRQNQANGQSNVDDLSMENQVNIPLTVSNLVNVYI